MFFKIGIFKHFAIFAGKRLCFSLFLKKLQRIALFIEHLRWLLLTKLQITKLHKLCFAKKERKSKFILNHFQTMLHFYIPWKVIGQLPPRKAAPRIIAPRIIAPWMITLRIIALRTNYPWAKLSMRKIASRKIAPLP